MSKFFDRHPKLAIAFNGAAKEIKSEENRRYEVTGPILWTAALTTLFGLPLFPAAVIATVFVATTLSGIGAYKALKAEKNNNKPTL